MSFGSPLWLLALLAIPAAIAAQAASRRRARRYAVRFPAVKSGDPPLRYWFASIEHPRTGAMVLPRHYAAMDSGFIVFPGVAHDTVRVLASSGDLLYGRRHVTYLLTTARAWGEPLDRAELEVDWPRLAGYATVQPSTPSRRPFGRSDAVSL